MVCTRVTNVIRKAKHKWSPAVKQNIVFRLNDELEQFFDEFNTWALNYITENSERLMGKPLSAEQVKFGYMLNVKRQEGRPPLVKVKLNMPGSSKATRCWTQEGEQIDFIEVWAGRSVKVYC